MEYQFGYHKAVSGTTIDINDKNPYSSYFIESRSICPVSGMNFDINTQYIPIIQNENAPIKIKYPVKTVSLMLRFIATSSFCSVRVDNFLKSSFDLLIFALPTVLFSTFCDFSL